MTDRQLAALRDAHARIGRLIAAWDEVTHWIDYRDAHHIAGTDYDRSGGSSSGEIRDLSIRVLRPNPGKLDRKPLQHAVDRIIGGSIDADDVRLRNLTTRSTAPIADERPSCSHCGLAERARGSLCRRCHEWLQRNGALPDGEVLSAWRRGKQPKQRVVG